MQNIDTKSAAGWCLMAVAMAATLARAEDAGPIDAGLTVEGDAGAAALADAGDTAAAPIAVVHRTQTLLFLDSTDPTSEARARAAVEALDAALSAPGPATVSVTRTEPAGLEIVVKGRVVLALTAADVHANAGTDVEAYADELAGRLTLFIADAERRAALQKVGFKVFLALLVAALGLTGIAVLRFLFARADEHVDDHMASFRPFAILGVPLL